MSRTRRPRLRRLLNVIAAFGVLAITATALVVAQPSTATAVPATIPLTITNDSGRGDQVFIYVLGDPGTGQLGWSDAAGTFHAWPTVGGTPVDAPDASIAGPTDGQSKTIQLPKMSGRVYFSYGTKLSFKVVNDGRLVQPAVQNPSDPNRNKLFSWTEFTLNDAGLWINSTQVDFLSAPYQTGLRKADGSVISTGMLKPDGYTNVVNALAGTPGWSNLAQRAPDGSLLRVLSPGHAIGTGQLDANVLSGYVDRVWAKYTNENLTVAPYSYDPAARFTGRVQNGVMRFTNASGAYVTEFRKPSSDSIFGCYNDLAAPNNDIGAIARTLCAGFNRSTLLTTTTQPGTSTSGFYQDSVTNYYAKYIHEQMANGKAYAFAFDDVVAQESLVHDGNPSAAYIQLDPFQGAATPIAGGDGGGGDGGSPLPAGTGAVYASNGMCVDIPWADSVNGNPLQIVNCSGNGAQTWTRSGSTLSALGRCMDVSGGSTADGGVVQLWECNGTGAQNWTYQSGNQALVNPQSGKCLTAVGGAPLHDGQRLEIRTCSGGAEQRWTF
ncbi:ricin-type beta-trefoil lectin protein [Promicromonospora sp. AC04]|uniref:beta-1,3-glucanase family protein n=1 Tax=Promicromonospora sp. AC04 TaxID=2135723 RepID=UPI000D3D22D5|nr:beta-1,3-glucanase family protein [Promicromonospora sp. AC04]PUB25502.1 ricin-type beta-trefoil lectin protein [Promicromonospora sp. AC04]